MSVERVFYMFKPGQAGSTKAIRAKLSYSILCFILLTNLSNSENAVNSVIPWFRRLCGNTVYIIVLNYILLIRVKRGKHSSTYYIWVTRDWPYIPVSPFFVNIRIMFWTWCKVQDPDEFWLISLSTQPSCTFLGSCMFRVLCNQAIYLRDQFDGVQP